MADPRDALTDADLEALSALLDDDLPASEAAALRERLPAEPALRAAWEAMQRLPGALAGLPADLPPPAALDAAVVAARAPAAPPSPAAWRPAAVGLAALAAGALLGLALQPPPTQLALGAGTHTVSGDLQLVAGGLPVTLDGRAVISVEPLPAGARADGRDPHPEDPVPLDSRTLAPAAVGAALGVAVTLAVQEGRATVQPPDGEALTLEAGQTRTLGGPAAAAPARSPTAPAAPAAPARDGLTLPEARARIAALEQQVADLSLERDLTLGALEQAEGVPQPWPEDLAPAFREEGFRSTLEAALAEAPDGVELLGVDCTEYPCVAMLHGTGDASQWTRSLHEGMTAELEAAGVADAGLGVWVNQDEDDQGEPITLTGVALSDLSRLTDDNKQRTDWRVEQWVQDAMDDRRPGDGAP